MRRMIQVKEYKDGEVIINDGLSVNKNGDVTVGRNLHVDGKIEGVGNSITIHNLEAGNNITIQYYDESGTQVSDSIGADETKTYNCNYFKIKCAISTVDAGITGSGGCLYEATAGWVVYNGSLSVTTSYSSNIIVHGQVKIECSK